MATNFDFSWYEKNQHDLIKFLDSYSNTLKFPYVHKDREITYSFFTDRVTLTQDRFYYLPEGERGKTTPFTEAEKIAFHAMIEYTSRYINLEFREVKAGTGDIRILHGNTTGGGYANYPGDYNTYQVLLVSDLVSDLESYFNNSQFLYTLWHEFGHTLGLKHPNSYEDSDTDPYLPDSLDSKLLSVMSYNHLYDYEFIRGTTFASLDLHTLRQMYGESNKSDGLGWRIIKKDDLQTGSSNLQSFNDNEFTFAVNHKENLVWVYGTASQDVLDVSSLIGIEDNTGLLVDLNLGTVTKADIDRSPYIEIYDNKNKSWVFNNFNKLSEIRIFPEKDPGKRIDTLILTSRSDSIILGDYINSVYADDGDDFFYGYSSNRIDGGDGLDTWEIPSLSHGFSLAQSLGGLQISKDATNVTHFFTNIEEINFSNTRFLIGSGSIANQAFRLYKAFDRSPDLEGLGYWIDKLADGTSLIVVADGFMESNEFNTIYGANVSNTNFIQMLYENVLDRQPDISGYTFWQNAIEENGITKSEMLVEFTESRENIANVAPLTQFGVLYQEWVG